MRTSAGRVRDLDTGTPTRPATPATASPPALGASTGPAKEPAAALISAILAHIDSSPCEQAALIGLTGERVDTVRLVDLAAGEPAALDAMQALLRDSESVAMVVFTDHRPPQWVTQPCYLLREVLVANSASTRALPVAAKGPAACGVPDGWRQR